MVQDKHWLTATFQEGAHEGLLSEASAYSEASESEGMAKYKQENQKNKTWYFSLQQNFIDKNWNSQTDKHCDLWLSVIVTYQ